MGEKRIQPEVMKSVTASFDVMDAKLETDISGMIQAPVTANFQSCTDEVKALTTSLVSTISSLDVYLNSVADVFSKVDSDIAYAIETNGKAIAKINQNYFKDEPTIREEEIKAKEATRIRNKQKDLMETQYNSMLKGSGA